MQQNRRGNGWIGWLIFIFLVFGSRFLPPIANWLSQATGLQISPPMLIAAVIGLGIAGTIISSVVQEINRDRRSSETRLPTGQPPVTPPRTITPPRRTSPPPSPGAGSTARMRMPSGEQRLPGPPRFEPIIDPRILTFGIVGLVILGGFFLLALLLTGSLP